MLSRALLSTPPTRSHVASWLGVRGLRFTIDVLERHDRLTLVQATFCEVDRGTPLERHVFVSLACVSPMADHDQADEQGWDELDRGDIVRNKPMATRKTRKPSDEPLFETRGISSSEPAAIVRIPDNVDSDYRQRTGVLLALGVLGFVFGMWLSSEMSSRPPPPAACTPMDVMPPSLPMNELVSHTSLSPPPPQTSSRAPQPPSARPARVAGTGVPLIIDTDMSFDVDDVGALCVAHALMDNGEADLLAVMANSGCGSSSQ